MDPDTPQTEASPPGTHDAAVAEVSCLNLPNALCVVRIATAPILAWLAYRGEARAYVYVYLLIAVTDLIDGRLARWLNQRTTLGARLDSIADATMYGAVILGLWWLVPHLIRRECFWIAAALGTYGLSVLTAMVRFGRPPSYHTHAAKSCWLLVVVAVVGLLAYEQTWPLRIVTVVVTVANLEAILITMVLRQWRADVPSLYHAIRWVRWEKG